MQYVIDYNIINYAGLMKAQSYGESGDRFLVNSIVKTRDQRLEKGYCHKRVCAIHAGIGDFEILDHRQETYLAYFSANLFTLDFSGQSCWIVVCSESLNPDIFGVGEYIVFIGLLEDDIKAEMVDWYRGMMLTVDSDFLAH